MKPIQTFLDMCVEAPDTGADYAGAVDRAVLCAEKQKLEAGERVSEYSIDLEGVDCDGEGGVYTAASPWTTLGACSAILLEDENPAVARLGALTPEVGTPASGAVVDPRAILTDQMEVGRDDLLAMLGVIGGALAGDLNGLSPEQEADVIEAVALTEEFLSAVRGAKSAPEDSVICRGMARLETCSQFPDLRRACPHTCEWAQAVCEMTTWAVCKESSWVQEACPRTCAAWERVQAEHQQRFGDIHSKARGGVAHVDVGFPSFPTADNDPSCACERDHRPVCSRKGVMYSNVCQARCQGEGATLDCSLLNPAVAFEVCAEQCTPVNQPVCSTKSGREFRNECHAACAGVTSTSPCGSAGIDAPSAADPGGKVSGGEALVSGSETRADIAEPFPERPEGPVGWPAVVQPGASEPAPSEGASEGGAIFSADSSAGVAAASLVAAASALATLALVL